MSIPKLDPDKKYNYADYLTWNDDERWELIEGVPFMMTPAPSEKHQRISVELVTEFNTYLRGKNCRVYTAPFDVRFSENQRNEEANSVVQPDLLVVCDKNKIDEKGCKGAPDLIIEILSPGPGTKRDKLYKFNLYQKYGVKEYWIVDPLNESIEVYILENEEYGERRVYSAEDKITVAIFEDLTIDLKNVFID